MKTLTKDLRGMSDEQLGLTLKDTEKHLFQLRLQSATDRLETPSEIKKAKKEIARITTIQRERELEKVNAQSADVIAGQIKDLQAKPEGPGKRRVKRSIQRLQALHAAKAAATKGKK